MDQQKLAEIFVHLDDHPQETKKEYLGQLKTILSNVTSADINEALVSISLETLFDCLGTNDGDQTQITCDILKILMSVIDPAEFLSKYEVYVLEGFKHPVSAVRAIVLEQLKRCINATSTTGANLLCTEYQDLIIASIHQICSDDLSVVKLVDEFIVNLAKTQPGAEFLLGPAGIESFNSILNNPRNSGVVKFRMYETLVNLGRISADHLEKLESQHHLVIQPLIEIISDSNDPLGQLNALEILANLVDTPHGYDAVSATDLITKLKVLSRNWKEDAMAGLIFPGVIKFIGKIGARVYPHDDLVKLVLDAISDGEEEVATVGIEALTFIGSTSNGKQNLDKQPDLKKSFEKIRSILQSGVQPYRSRTLNALAILFGSDEQNERCLPFWFYQIFPDITELYHLVQQPFPDIRLSSLNFLGAIAHIEWAQKHYLRVPGVLEFLTNRSIESNQECALAKFRVVSIIVDSLTAKNFIKPDDLSLLKMHVEQGPFYVVAKPTMATEGAD